MPTNAILHMTNVFDSIMGIFSLTQDKEQSFQFDDALVSVKKRLSLECHLHTISKVIHSVNDHNIWYFRITRQWLWWWQEACWVWLLLNFLYNDFKFAKHCNACSSSICAIFIAWLLLGTCPLIQMTPQRQFYRFMETFITPHILPEPDIEFFPREACAWVK